MAKQVRYRLKDPKDAVFIATVTALRGMDKWREVLKPVLDQAIDDLKADGFLPSSMPSALDDFGKYCQAKGRELQAERERLGLKTPEDEGGE